MLEPLLFVTRYTDVSGLLLESGGARAMDDYIELASLLLEVPQALLPSHPSIRYMIHPILRSSTQLAKPTQSA